MADVSAAPVALARGGADDPEEVHLVSPAGLGTPDSGAAAVARRLADSLAGSEPPNEAVGGDGWAARLAAGSVAVVAVDSLALADAAEPPAGGGLLIVPEPLVPASADVG